MSYLDISQIEKGKIDQHYSLTRHAIFKQYCDSQTGKFKTNISIFKGAFTNCADKILPIILTTYLRFDICDGIPLLLQGKICIPLTFPVPLTIYIPCLVKVVCERPLTNTEKASIIYQIDYKPTDYRRPMKPFFFEIQKFWAWAR